MKKVILLLCILLPGLAFAQRVDSVLYNAQSNPWVDNVEFLSFDLKGDILYVKGKVSASPCGDTYLKYEIFDDSIFLKKVEPLSTCEAIALYDIDFAIDNCSSGSYRIIYKDNFISVDTIVYSRVVSSGEYIPLLSETKQWNVLYETAASQKTTHVFKMKGDTAIEGRNYSVLWYSVDEHVEDWRKLGFLHENTEERKVYYRPVWGDNDGLLYDFSVVEGDTVYTIGHSWYGPDKPVQEPWTVDSTINIVKKMDSIKLNDKYYKRITVESKPLTPDSEGFIFENEWIEGMGNFKGVFSYNVLLSGTPNQMLLAYYQNEELIYQSPEHDSDFIWNTVNNDYIENHKISVFLNGRNLHISGLSGQPCLVSLYSINGTSLLQKTVGSSSLIIPLSDISSGIYIVNLNSGKKNISKKIVIK